MEYLVIALGLIGLGISGLLYAIWKKLDWIGYVTMIEFDKINDGIFLEDVCKDCQHEE